MVDIEQQEYEEPEIGLLKEWLPRISGVYRAYIKGVSKALLYTQEMQGGLLYPDNAGFEQQRSNGH